MSQTSNIEWADATFNLWAGCQKVGPGWDHYYAETRNAYFGRADVFDDDVPVQCRTDLMRLTDSLQNALGNPVDTMLPQVRLLQLSNPSIEKRYEGEQAALLHWLLTLWFRNGDNWRKACGEEIGRMREALAAQARANKGGE